MTQKFFRGQRVHVTADMPLHMRHFDAGFDAIVDHSYSDIYGGSQLINDKLYSLCQLENGRPINRLSWYYENQLTLLDDDRSAGEVVLQEYKARK